MNLDILAFGTRINEKRVGGSHSQPRLPPNAYVGEQCAFRPYTSPVLIASSLKALPIDCVSVIVLLYIVFICPIIAFFHAG